jgi:hypothetical protein
MATMSTRARSNDTSSTIASSASASSSVPGTKRLDGKAATKPLNADGVTLPTAVQLATRPSATGGCVSGSDACYFCKVCKRTLTDDTPALQCEGCRSDHAWICVSCLGMPLTYYQLLMKDDKGICWFCDNCRPKAVPSRKLETALSAIDSKIQLLLDLSIPSTDGKDVSGDNGVLDEPSALARPWNKLFGQIADVGASVNSAVDNIKQCVTANLNKQPNSTPATKSSDTKDDVTRSVVIYGLHESKDIHDITLIDQLVHGLDAGLSISSFRRLRPKKSSSTPSVGLSGPPPVMLVMSTEFEQRKLLALAPNLRASDSFDKVFVKQALTSDEMLTISKLRTQCRQINEDNFHVDPSWNTKLVVLDGKIRASRKQSDGSWKADWKTVVSSEQLSTYLLKNRVATSSSP